MRKALVAAFAVIWSCGEFVALAGTATAALDVATNVSPRCLVSASNLEFGTYDPLGANATADLDATAEITVTCTKGLVGTIVLAPGRSGGRQPRSMSAGPGALAYQIFSDRARSRIWADAPPGGEIVLSQGAHLPVRLRLFGRVPAGQRVLAGRYTDAVTASVLF